MEALDISEEYVMTRDTCGFYLVSYELELILPATAKEHMNTR